MGLATDLAYEVLDVTTTGRKSGRARTSHLISIPIDDTLALQAAHLRARAGLTHEVLPGIGNLPPPSVLLSG